MPAFKTIKDNQEAFNYGALEEFGLPDDHFVEDGEIISRETIEQSIDGGEAYRIMQDGQPVGGVVIKVEGERYICIHRGLRYMAYDFYIRKKQDLIDAIRVYGIVPYFSTSIPGFSLQEHCHPAVLFSDTGDDTWEWKGPVIRETGCAYGKFFEKKAAYVSRKLFLDLANYRRDGYDFDARYDDGLAKFQDKQLYGPFTGRADHPPLCDPSGRYHGRHHDKNGAVMSKE